MRDQGTYAPTDGLNRWMPSAAMDKSGDIAVGYSTSNGTAPNYPSIRYATRLATDPPGTLGSEETIMLGTGSQTGPARRWGDYSSMSVDPNDDCTFFYAQEYIQTTGATSWRTRIGKFTIPACGPPPRAAAATAATPATAATAAASSSNGRLRDHDRHRDDRRRRSRPGHPLRRLLPPRDVPVPGEVLQHVLSTSAFVSSNGVVNFSGENLQYANGCLPARVEGRAIVVLWDDMNTAPSGRGVFTKTVGSAPNRQFIINFNMAYLNGGGTVNAEVVFTEGQRQLPGHLRLGYPGGPQLDGRRPGRRDRHTLHPVRMQPERADAGYGSELRLFGTASASAAAATTTAASATTSAASATSATTSAAASAASAATRSASDGALQGAAGGRADPGQGEDEDPPRALLGRAHPASPLTASRARHRAEPEAGRRQAPRLPGQARRRPPLKALSQRHSCPRGPRVC